MSLRFDGKKLIISIYSPASPGDKRKVFRQPSRKKKSKKLFLAIIIYGHRSLALVFTIRKKLFRARRLYDSNIEFNCV